MNTKDKTTSSPKPTEEFKSLIKDGKDRVDDTLGQPLNTEAHKDSHQALEFCSSAVTKLTTPLNSKDHSSNAFVTFFTSGPQRTFSIPGTDTV